MKKYLVGGAVRDTLLHLPIKDRDWVVVGATPQAMLAKGFQPVGRDFPVFLHPISREEYALARTERKTGRGHAGFATHADPTITLEQDLQRRDITINAIALDEAGNYIDPYGGRNDIHARQLRHVSLAFREDPLRVLRVARFAARLHTQGFRIADDTYRLMHQMVQEGELRSLTAERVWQETARALLTDNPHIYFRVLRDCGALRIICPEINRLFTLPTPSRWHSDIDMGTHTLQALAAVVDLSSELAVRFAVLVHDIDRVALSAAHQPQRIPLAVCAVPQITALCERLRVPSALRQLAQLAAQWHDAIEVITELTADQVVVLLDKLDAWRKPARVDQIALISQANGCGHKQWQLSAYPQGDYLRHAFQLAQSVDSRQIAASGLTGYAIREELTRQRAQHIETALRSK